MIAARRSYGFVFPTILVVGGVLILLANLGTLPADAGWRLLQLWPLLLVMLGVELLVPYVFHGGATLAASLLLVGLIAAGGVAYALAGPTFGGGAYTRFQSTSPATGISAGSLTVDAAGAQVTIRSGGSGDQLYKATIDYAGSAPRFSYADGKLHISSNQNGFLSWNSRRDVIDLALDPSVPWTVVINGAGTTAAVDFGDAAPASLTVNGVGGTLTLGAGKPDGVVPVSLTGVGTNLVLNLPAGTEYRVTTHGIGTSVEGSSQTAGWESASDRYDVTVDGIGAHATVRVTGQG
jgi:hypothetical protein